MSSIKAAKVISALTRKGFIRENRDHITMLLMVNGVLTKVGTCISHGADDCGARLLAVMSRQLHLSKNEIKDLIDCPLSGEEYLDIIRKKGILKKV